MSTARAAASSDELFGADFERRLEGLALVARRVFEGRFRAERRSKKSGAGIEFADHREYAPGDDFRFVDVRLFGRTDRLFVKLFEEEEDLSVHVLVDVSRSMAVPTGDATPTKLVIAKRLAAALAYIALSGLDRVSVATMADGKAKVLPAVRGKARIHRVLELLALESHATMGGPGATDLEGAVRAFSTQTKRRGLAILVSDLYDPKGFELALDRLRHARFEVVVLQIWDPREASRLGTGDLVLVDSESGERREVTLTPELLRRFEEAQTKQRQRVAAYCRQKQVAHADVSIELPWDESVLRVLARGGLVA
ncbi:MAG: DUF58 domain-containing protein [Sandaracinaceae bacterium]|nr:DUF58 domain-containing protein [Sandaracinaceae bacterium]